MLGMGLDTIPQSLAIGAAFSSPSSAVALALLFGIQNVAEGVAFFGEMKQSKAWLKKRKNIFIATKIISIFPLITGLAGLSLYER